MQLHLHWFPRLACVLICCGALAQTDSTSTTEPAPTTPTTPAKPEYPPHTEILKDYEQVISSIDKTPSLLQIWVRRKDNQMLAVFPQKFEAKRFFIAMTVASGERYAGLQAGDMYVYWRRHDNRMVLLTPNLDVRSTGEAESKASVERLFTDRVIVDVPILTMVPNLGPVIDMDNLLVGEAGKFFGAMVRGAQNRLATIKTAKAFPGNVELAFELPMADGILKTLHYSISEIKPTPGYKPRPADSRVGYFTTTYADLGRYQAEENRVRYVNRWHLEKADPSLTISPPKVPIVFYIEHTTPIRYRRWVRQGVLMWNKAFEQVGLANAIEVYYQDASTGAHMEKDPEDVRYNFVRWLNNDVGTAIGPSRVDPLTGQILDADIILTDGWIRHYWRQFHEMIPGLALEGLSPDTLAWLQARPQWDPRVRLAPPASREALFTQILSHGPQPYGGHPMAEVDPTLVGTNDYDGLIGRTSQFNGFCRAAECKAIDLAAMRISFELLAATPSPHSSNGEDPTNESDPPKPKPAEPEPKESLLDGIPESFIGPLIAELVAHEVGHTLGLRHNFRASSVYTLEQINCPTRRGNMPFAGSVMDYLPVNIYDWENPDNQGDYAMINIGPYDIWAIEYGYTLSDKPDDLKSILARASEPELTYATDEDTIGPDPLARRYDFGADPLAYARKQLELASYHRERLLNQFVKEGQSWARARYGYEMTLALRTRALTMMSAWIGGTFLNRDKKGDPGNRTPIEVVPVEAQREALQFVLEEAFRDEAFGLTTDLLLRMSVDKWLDRRSGFAFEEATWPVHDRIMGIQSTVLTRLLNPGTLGRVYDNEFLTPAEQDTITLPEILAAVEREIWSELRLTEGEFTARQPMISSLRRNLQREHLERLIDLSMPERWRQASHKPIATLALMNLRKLGARIERTETNEGLDDYTRAHLAEARLRIEKALDAGYLLNTGSAAGVTSGIIVLGTPAPAGGSPGVTNR